MPTVFNRGKQIGFGRVVTGWLYQIFCICFPSFFPSTYLSNMTNLSLSVNLMRSGPLFNHCRPHECYLIYAIIFKVFFFQIIQKNASTITQLSLLVWISQTHGALRDVELPGPSENQTWGHENNQRPGGEVSALRLCCAWRPWLPTLLSVKVSLEPSSL